MLSVVIPTRNRAVLLAAALESLQTQRLSPSEFEVLVVDNGSEDDTKGIVTSFQSRMKNLRYFFEPAPGLHVGRHRGMKEARGEVIVYADDDIVATPSWLEAIADCFRSPAVAMVGGNNLPRFEGAPPNWLQKLWAKPVFGGRAIPYLSILELPPGRRSVSPFLIWGCNFSVRKRVLVDAGGFHPDSMPEDWIRFRGDGETHVSFYVYRMGLESCFDSRASVYHTVPASRMTIEYFSRRAFNQGISDSYTHLRNAPQSRARRVVRNMVAKSRRLVGGVVTRLRDIAQSDPELRTLASAIREGYRRGYAYHQRAYREDPEVRAWVHKPDYF